MRLTLAGRVFLHGLTLLVCATLLVAGFGRWMVDEQQSRNFDSVRRWMEADTCLRLREHSEPGPMPSSRYSDEGVLLSTTITPPLPPLEADELAELERRPRAPGNAVFRCEGLPGYVVAGPPFPPPAGLPWLGALLLALLVLVAVASLPFARSLVRPLTRLVEVTRRLGAGDLSARVDSSRSDELGEVGLAVDAMAARLDAAVRAQSELLANVSHELRTPLSRIRVVLELAEENPARAQSLLAEIRRDLTDLERLLDGVLTAIRLDRGLHSGAALPLELIDADPRAFLTEVATAFRLENPERELKLDLAAELPRVMIDPRLLRRALDNLLENARRYSDGAIALSATVERSSLVVRLRDDGVGIEASELAHVFTPFYRVDRSRTRATGGVGLGLPLARGIVERHGGRLTLESEPHRGTCAVLELPLPE